MIRALNERIGWRLTGAAWLWLVAAALMLCGALDPAQAEVGPVRVVTRLSTGWRFHDGSEPLSAAQPTFDDHDWQKVELPHSWNALGEYGLHRTAKTRNRQGEGWYRLWLEQAQLPRRQRRFLQFDGVGNVADVWVNGHLVAHHAGAFSGFRVDITDALNRIGRNLIAVRADNSRPAPGSPTEDVIPLNGDFFIHGGLYRPVSLIGVGPTHIDLLDHGGPGVYIRTSSLEPGAAKVAISTRLARDGSTNLVLRTRILDGAGRCVSRDVAAAARDEVNRELVIRRPRLWEGRQDPYLYSAVVELLDRGRVVDRVQQQFGIRTFRFDSARGFFLNGRHVSLHGVSRHQDVLGKGWALDHADHARDMAMIEELGANTIRMAHYQHAQDWYDLADAAGMVVWAEIPFVNKLSFGNSPASPALVANAREQLTELIRQNYNHPSVAIWSIGNETDIDVAFGRLGPKADPRPLLDELRRVARAEDPDRSTAIADCCESTPSVKIAGLPVLAGHSDVIGYNRYYGWYYGKTGDLGPHLDALHARHPAIPMAVSEYGAGAALSQHSDNPEGGPIMAGGRPHPEEYQGWLHEQSWPQLRARPYLFATWIWNMFDFSSTARNEGDSTDINDKGLVTFDRKVRKDAFYYYQAQWRHDIAVLHVAGRRYVDRAYPVTDVRIYSNLDKVELWLNGRPAGSVPCVGGVCVLHDLHLNAGANSVVAQGMFKGKVIRDEVTWNAPDAKAGLAIKVGDLVGFSGIDGHRVGSDNWFEGGTAARIAADKAAALKGEGDPSFRTALRTGAFRYAIPVPDGRWSVTLVITTRNDDAPAPFLVTAQGLPVLSVEALPLNSVVERSFDTKVSNGKLNLVFGPSARLSGIIVRPR